MKYFFLTVHLCFFSILYSQSVKQNSKGVSPIGNNELQNSIHKNTYAVVVGISDYQDKDIPDLRFADKDAEAFANFLRSPAGGSLDGDHLKVLTNKEATMGQFAAALDWLWEVSKEGDLAIIYFSGHGDVEGKKISQPGFLLAWDAPSRVYMGGGTYSLSFLQEVVTTLTVQSKAKVLVITDACHAGKLAGSQIGGAQLTTANLAKQYANEMKILSCQPNEFSLEGPQWGGGRGVFSYHLVEGLFGLADRNNDGQITLGEIDRYLEDHVTGEAAPQSQVPILLGNKTDRIATVNASILAELKRNKTGSMQVFASTDSRGFEEEMLSKVDTSIRDIYKNFKLAVLEKRFLEPAGNCAEDYYTLLIQVEALLPLRGIMKRNYAAALQDDAQQVINDWIKIGGDHFTLSRIKQIEKYKNYPSLLNRAAALLGSEHYFYKPLIARKYFFEAYLLRMINPVNFDEELGKKVLNMLRTSLFYDSDFPQTFWLMSITHAYNLWKSDSANYYALKAVSLAPTWALPFNDLANFHNHISLQDSKVYELLNQARAIDSNMVSTSFNRPKLLDSLHGASYSKTVTINLKHEISFQYAFVLPAYLEGDTISSNRESQLIRSIHFDTSFASSYYELGYLYLSTKRYAEAEQVYKKAIELNSTSSGYHRALGRLYFFTKRYAEAEQLFKKAIELNSTNAYSYSSLGKLYLSTKRYAEAEQLFKKAIELDSTVEYFYVSLGIVYLNTKRYAEAEQLYKKAIEVDSTASFYYIVACVYSNINNLDKAFENLDHALKLGYNDYDWIQRDEDFILLRDQTEQWSDLMKKYFPEKMK